MIRPVPHIGAMAPYALADPGPEGAVSLAQNESAFAPSPAAIAAGRAAVASADLYPDPDWTDLRAAISERYGPLPGTILCGAGSMELIGAIIRCFAPPGSEVLGTAHGYLFAATAAAQVDARFVSVAEPGLRVDVRRLAQAAGEHTAIVFLCNPGNPTGTVIGNDDILKLRSALSDRVLLVVDQAYGEFSDDAAPPGPLFDLVAQGNTCLLRTFSKAYALAGARVGWGVFPNPVASELRKVLNPNNVSGVSQAMAAAAMRDPDHMQSIVMDTAVLRDRFAKACRALGFDVPVSHTNFVLLRFANVGQAQRVDAALRAQGYLARGMGGYRLPECLRVTIGAPDVMDALPQIIGKALL